MGLNYSWISETIENKTYTAGFYYIGIGHSFIKYPKSVITIDFSSDYGADYPGIKSRTSDGLEVDIEVSFQYQLDPTKLYDLYFKYNEDYHRVLDLMAIDILTTNTTEYSAYNFFWSRQEIATNMMAQLNKYFQKWGYANVLFFQLRTVNLPLNFEDAIQKTEVTKQSINQAQATKNKTEVEFQTDIMKASYQANVTINVAEGDANQRITQAQAQANMTKSVQSIKSQAYAQLKQSLNMDSASLVDYIKNKVILGQNSGNLIIGMNQGNGCPSQYNQNNNNIQYNRGY
ncbi:hypothetical protein PPERSA_10545 [Pseudocohnilembus persalinus]|uniref:Band 7 domain-containing protein n=1 Tax=Pseudocohnilembus persalinus TaxID=266149 RepID=A0A0V0QLT0_PSEPJ|nr:hypothetical protein PPERSA_10545 [Pseudocohnilembus persalinus]|eukprot:KRX03172.1 hypothetical protein PPERSA_10545 [Pseudocohnilembus persalinus]